MQNLSDKFTVLMAVYFKDDEALFERAIQSVLSNSLLPAEFILICDGPLTPGLDVIVSHYGSSGLLRVLRSERNLGLAGALNYALDHIKTQYVIRADADDFNYPGRFKSLVTKLECGFDVVGSAIREIDSAGMPLALRKPPLSEDEIRRFARWRSPFNHMTVAFRTDAVRRVGGYPEIYLREDYSLWAKLLARGARVCNLPDVLVDASAGNAMLKRRGGVKYALGEIELQKLLVSSNLSTPFFALLATSIRCTIFLLPVTWRGFIYTRFLRHRVRDI